MLLADDRLGCPVSPRRGQSRRGDHDGHSERGPAVTVHLDPEDSEVGSGTPAARRPSGSTPSSENTNTLSDAPMSGRVDLDPINDVCSSLGRVGGIDGDLVGLALLAAPVQRVVVVH